jgi:hypothetical protein
MTAPDGAKRESRLTATPAPVEAAGPGRAGRRFAADLMDIGALLIFGVGLMTYPA